MNDKIVQYIIVREDLKMSHGKMAAQVAHASLGSVYPHMNEPFVQEWLNGAFTKIVLRAKTFQQLTNLVQNLVVGGIEHREIWDNCLTELTPESERGTLTCVGIMPYPKSQLLQYLRKFQLY